MFADAGVRVVGEIGSGLSASIVHDGNLKTINPTARLLRHIIIHPTRKLWNPSSRINDKTN